MTTTTPRHDTVETATPDTGPNQPPSSSRHDPVMTPCPVCTHPFVPIGRQAYCTPACRAAAYRRRHHANQPPITVPKAQPRRPITVYQCDTCDSRALGQQYCDDCHTFMRRVGLGGCCPSCDEPIAVTELLDQPT